MRARKLLLAATSGLALALAGCDGSVAFPGFDERPTEREHIPPPNQPTNTPIADPVLPDPVGSPETDDTAPDSEPAETPTEPDTGDTAEDETALDDTTEPDDTAPGDDPSDAGVETPDEDTAPDSEPGEEPADPTPDTDASDTEESDTAEDDTAPSDTPDTDETASGDNPSEADDDSDDTQPEDTAADAEDDTAPESELERQPDNDPAETPTERPDPIDEDIAPTFSYHAPGDLLPGSGLGSPNKTVHAPNMVFPIQAARAFPHSMVFRPGGFRYTGDLPGDECIPENYVYPWRDNFCERGRSPDFGTPHCPAGNGIHLGQDIRVGDGRTCQSMRQRYRTNTQSITDYKVVAAEDGVISNIGSYTVTLRSGPRTYRYLHLNMRALQVRVGDEVKAGQHLGYVSKDFGFKDGKRRPTTFHLHFELLVNTENGAVFVSPYSSLVAAYARREGGPGEEIERTIAIASDAALNTSDEVFEFSE